MPFATTTAQDAALDAVVSSWATDAVTWRLYYDLPEASTELPSDGGYAPVAYTGSEWAAASGGVKTTSAAVDFGTSTAAWGEVAAYWAIVDAAGDPIFWDELPQAVNVSAAGVPVSFSPVLFFRDI